MLLLDHVAMDEQGKAGARHAVGLLQPHGTTNLSEGWLLAAEGVAKAMVEGAVNRTIILTDGLTNKGICDREELARHAAALRGNGIATSTVGIGNDYDSVLLQRLASEGGGLMHDAEVDREIEEVLEGELAELRKIALENVYFSVTLPPDLRTECLSPMPVTRLEQGLRIFVGSLGAGASRSVVLRLTFPAGERGRVLPVSFEASGTDPVSGETRSATAATSFELAGGTINNAQPRNETVAAVVARTWHGDLARQAIAMNRNGQRDEAREYLLRVLPRFEKYIIGIEGGADLARELRLMAERIHNDWDERSRKEIELSMYKGLREEVDYRRDPRGRGFDRL